MSKQEHKYAQVLRWIADGEKVLGRHISQDEQSWTDVREWNSTAMSVMLRGGEGYEFRLAPRTVTVNGVECVAPEKVAPGIGVRFYVPYPTLKKWCADSYWEIEEWQSDLLTRGLVFLQEEHAIAYAKAMCNYKDGKQ